MADASESDDPLHSFMPDFECLDQAHQQLESDYQHFNRAIAEARRLKNECTQKVANEQDQLAQIKNKLDRSVDQHGDSLDVNAIKQKIDARCCQLEKIKSHLLILKDTTLPLDDGVAAGTVKSNKATTVQKKTANQSANPNQQKKVNTSGVVRPQFQVRTDGYQQRIDHYITQRQMEPKHRRQLQLESILNLQKSAYSKKDQNLLDVMLKATFVGCVDENLFLMQHELNLVLVTIRPLNEELFYQMILVDFGNFDYIEFQKPLPLSELAAIYLRYHKPAVANVAEEANNIIKPLLELNHTLMLKDYFSLKINLETGTLEAVPWIIKGHMPVMTFLPDLIYNLALIEDWTDEESCLNQISQHLTAFYARPPTKFISEEEQKTWASNVERLFFPLYKTLLVPSGELRTKGSFFTLTNITELYKFFERC